MLTREQILQALIHNLSEPSRWALAILKRENRSIPKEKLGDFVNEAYQSAHGTKLLNSRHSLDDMTARLEGGGLVVVEGIGRARLYSLSPLGQDVIVMMQQKK